MTAAQRLGKGLMFWALGSVVGLLAPLWLAGLSLYLVWRRWRERVDVRRVLSLALRSNKENYHVVH